MAVRKMKLISVTGPIERLDHVVRHAFDKYQFQPENALSILKRVDGLFPFGGENPYLAPLRKICDLLDMSGLRRTFCGFDDSKDYYGLDEFYDETSRHLSELYSTRDALMAEVTEKTRLIRQLEPFLKIDVNLENILNFEYIKFRFGSLPADSYKRYKMYMSEAENVMFFPSFYENNLVWGVYFTPKEHAGNIDSMFASLHFDRQRIPREISGTPTLIINDMKEQIVDLNARIRTVTGNITKYVDSKRGEILSFYSQLRFLSDSFEIKRYAAHSEKSFYLVGWVPDDQSDGFISQFANLPEIACIKEDPAENRDILAPTDLKNWVLFRPFEEFVTMYGVPGYDEFDPTPLFAITYLLMFGMMFGDIGQGALLLIGGLLLYRFKKMNIGRVIASAGVFSMIFGLVYGSVFGIEHLLPGFKPLHNSTTINISVFVAVGLGIVLISVVMIINIINGIRQRNMGKALFHFNGAAGFIFYWAVIAAVLFSFGFGKNILSPLYIALTIAVPLIVIYLREPLGALLEGRKNWRPDNLGEFLLENFFELFEVMLSYITNTISFVRVGAFAINHAGMMLAVFIIADMAGKSASPLVIILGNLLVIGLEGLIVGIQVLRLEFYELFGRFFGAEGYTFAPIKLLSDENSDGGI